MTRLWDKGAPLDEHVLAYTAGEDYALDERLVPYDARASIAHAEMLHAQQLLAAADLDAIRSGLQALVASHARGEWQIELADEDGQTALEKRLTALIGPAGGRVHLGRSRNDQVLTARAPLPARRRRAARRRRRPRSPTRSTALAAREGALALPGYTHMQQAMPSSVALWAGGFASELRDDAHGLRLVHRRVGRSPLGSAAGYGSPGLPIDRAATARALGFAEVQEPVTAVQLSRGKAEAQLLFEVTLLMQDLGRFAADVLLFYTQEFAFLALPEAFTTGSSIMPQKRNPDVFELVRGRTATAQACLVEALGIFAKLPSGYQRDLQLLKLPLFRGIDLALATTQILVPAIDAMRFRPENVELDPSIHAAEQANALVVSEGIPFREAYRRVGAALRAEQARRHDVNAPQPIWREGTTLEDVRAIQPRIDARAPRHRVHRARPRLAERHHAGDRAHLPADAHPARRRLGRAGRDDRQHRGEPAGRLDALLAGRPGDQRQPPAGRAVRRARHRHRPAVPRRRAQPGLGRRDRRFARPPGVRVAHDAGAGRASAGRARGRGHRTPPRTPHRAGRDPAAGPRTPSMPRLTRPELVDLCENRYFGNVVRERLDAVLACFTPDTRGGDPPWRQPRAALLRPARRARRRTSRSSGST